MNIFEDISGGRVLDVATGRGGSAKFLAENLQDFTEIIGVDPVERHIHIARDAVDRENVHFMPMDGKQLGFANERFDTACIFNSLHHLANLPHVLGEMLRVLRPGARFILSEMYHDGEQTAPQLTAIYMHHWAAEIDTAQGFTHNPTFTRQEIVDIVAGLNLHGPTFHDHYAGPDSDPKDEERLKGCDEVIDRCIQRAEGLPNYETLKQRGEALRERLHDVGTHGATRIVVVGEKE
jgi:SAM-dependent methyltransferase